MKATWQPTCSLDAARARAGMLARLRSFFAERGLLEVDTPILQGGPNRDHGVEPMRLGEEGWLITSPEHHLKRLLCAGWPDCWTLAPCFRAGEHGRRHNPEFRLVEWYRRGWRDDCLAEECCALIARLADRELPVETISYRDAFESHAGLDPFSAGDDALASALGAELASVGQTRRGMLDLLLTERVEPQLGHHGLTVLTDYPADQAAQARHRDDAHGDRVAARFEVYWRGVELANGYHECTDAEEMAARFAADSQERGDDAQDERYLAALRAGLPACAGVALGFDRVLMLHLGRDDIAQVIAFPWERC